MKKVNSRLLLLLLVCGVCTNLFSQIRLTETFDGDQPSGQILKTDARNNSIIFGVPKSPNMYNIYFNVGIQGMKQGDFYIRTVSDDPNFLPDHAVYRFSDKEEWCFVPKVDSATYRIYIPKGVEQIQFSSGIPYTYGMMEAHFGTLSHCVADIIELDKKSLGGNTVKVVRITDKDTDDTDKQSVWILGGQHTFETPALQTVRYTIDFLVSDHPDAYELRRKSIFYICPIVDVDASMKGLSGKRLLGRGTQQVPIQDLNWDWNVTLHSKHHVKNTKGGPNSYDNISHPQIKSLQELIYTTSSKNPLRFFIDHHAPFPVYAPWDDTVSFHIIDKYLPESKRSYSNANGASRKFWDKYEELMGFRPVVLRDNEEHIKTANNSRIGHSYSYGPGQQFDYERSADYWVDSENALYYRNTLAQANIFFSTTIETGWYNTPFQNNGPYAWWDEYTYQQHAKSLCQSMLSLMKDIPEVKENDRIIDITADKKLFKFKGDWKETATQIPNTIIHHKQGLAWATTQKGSTVSMKLTPDHAGIYDIYIWSEPMYKSPFAPRPNYCLSDSNVQITIFNGEEYFYSYVDQTKNGGMWKKVTTLFLDPEKNPTLEIKKIKDDQSIVIADAIRLSPSEGLPQAPVTMKKD